MADITLGTVNGDIVFVRETTHEDGRYNEGDQVYVQNTRTGAERRLTGQEAREVVQRGGSTLIPGRRLEQISDEIHYHSHLNTADRYLNVGNYRRALQQLGLAMTRARRAGVTPDRARISDVWSRGVQNLTRIQDQLSHRRHDLRSERVSRWIDSYTGFGNILNNTDYFTRNVSDRMLQSAVSVVFWRDWLDANHQNTPAGTPHVRQASSGLHRRRAG